MGRQGQERVVFSQGHSSGEEMLSIAVGQGQPPTIDPSSIADQRMQMQGGREKEDKP